MAWGQPQGVMYSAIALAGCVELAVCLLLRAFVLHKIPISGPIGWHTCMCPYTCIMTPVCYLHVHASLDDYYFIEAILDISGETE